jgi:subfamily B ATP-binding cassette protein MsbA
VSEKKRSVLLRYLAYAWPYKAVLLLVVLAGVAKFTVPLIPQYMSRLIIDNVGLNKANMAHEARVALLWHLAAALIAVAVVKGIVTLGRGYFTVRASSGVAFDLRQDLWRHLQRLSLGYHQSRPTGSILSRLMSDIAQAQQMINQGIINVIIDMVSGTAALVVLLYISWQLTLVVIAVLPLLGMLYRKVNPRLRQASRDVQEQTAVMSGQAVERLAGIAVVQSFAQEREEQASFAAQAGELRGRFVRRGMLGQIMNSCSEFLIGTASYGVWVVWAVLALRGELTPGQLFQFVGTAALLYMPISRLSEINITYQTSMAAIERIFAVFDEVPDVREKPDVADRAPTEGRLAFANVSFNYGSGGGDVLTELTFEVAPGERIAVVGESGAGKSTLVTLIPRLYDVTGGAITIDGVDVRDYPLERLRKSIGIVLQDTILFSGSVRENLRYGRKEAEEEEIIEAARLANAHEFIMSLPEGYDTLLGERGLTVSGGQRQRLSLARTILQNPRILILDEATSSLDSESENLITEALRRVMVGRTSLIIAHRLSTVTNANRILVLKEGRLVETGRHRDLLQADGHYSYLFEQQFRPLQEIVSQVERMR